MSNSEPAKNIITAMYQNLDKEITQGDCAKAISTIDTYLGGIINNSASTRATFGSTLMILYATRAKLRYESGESEAAKEDVQKAVSSLGEFYTNLKPEQKEPLRAWIPFVISPEAQQRSQAIGIINQWRGIFPQNTAKTPDRSDAGRARPGQPLSGAKTFQQYGIPFIIGAVAWVLAFVILSQAFGKGESNTPVAWLGIIIILGLFVLSYQGWDWNKQYRVGTAGSLIKWIAIVLICFTGIGLIFTAFWTGKRIMELAGKENR